MSSESSCEVSLSLVVSLALSRPFLDLNRSKRALCSCPLSFHLDFVYSRPADGNSLHLSSTGHLLTSPLSLYQE